jgi:hypothetical protein
LSVSISRLSGNVVSYLDPPEQHTACFLEPPIDVSCLPLVQPEKCAGIPSVAVKLHELQYEARTDGVNDLNPPRNRRAANNPAFQSLSCPRHALFHGPPGPSAALELFEYRGHACICVLQSI